MLPQFKYQPNAYKNGVFKSSEQGRPVICECCGEETQWYYVGIYAEDEVEAICPECITSGEAAREFDGQFVQVAVKDNT